MIANRGINVIRIIQWSGHHLAWLSISATALVLAYYYGWFNFSIPWLPVSVIGTAVAFYVGFKNNSAYARMWEARKIWGAIVNSSRAWGTYVDGFVTDQFTQKDAGDHELKKVKQTLIYRHIAWLYTLRNQLLQVTPWEHAAQKSMVGVVGRYYQKRFGIGLVEEEADAVDIKKLLPEKEYDRLMAKKNTATQIINEQSRHLRELRQEHIIEDFRHMEMEQILYHFYEHQGKCERIKKFPLPRQYANMSRIFIGVFIILLPFSMIPEMMKLGDWGIWLSIPIMVIIGWVYITMEVVGDYTENPFQGMANDIPMLSLCRTIEIDLREMLEETDLPPAIPAKKGILM